VAIINSFIVSRLFFYFVDVNAQFEFFFFTISFEKNNEINTERKKVVECLFNIKNITAKRRRRKKTKSENTPSVDHD